MIDWLKSQRRKLLLFLRLRGCSSVGTTPMGNQILRVNRDGVLGPRGTRIFLSRDDVMYPRVENFASWEPEVCAFLADGLREISRVSNSRNLFLDLGGNAGLVTLQSMNLARTDNEIIIVEPMARHIEAIRQNLEPLRVRNRVTIGEFALGERSGRSEILQDLKNWGNISLLEGAMMGGEHDRFSVEVRDAGTFFSETLARFDRIVLKSDMQGFDAKVLAQISADGWAKVERAAIEVWALPEVSAEDVDRLMDLWRDFAINHEELAKFWKSGSGDCRDLELER